MPRPKVCVFVMCPIREGVLLLHFLRSNTFQAPSDASKSQRPTINLSSSSVVGFANDISEEGGKIITANRNMSTNVPCKVHLLYITRERERVLTKDEGGL